MSLATSSLMSPRFSWRIFWISPSVASKFPASSRTRSSRLRAVFEAAVRVWLTLPRFSATSCSTSAVRRGQVLDRLGEVVPRLLPRHLPQVLGDLLEVVAEGVQHRRQLVHARRRPRHELVARLEVLVLHARLDVDVLLAEQALDGLDGLRAVRDLVPGVDAQDDLGAAPLELDVLDVADLDAGHLHRGRLVQAQGGLVPDVDRVARPPEEVGKVADDEDEHGQDEQRPGEEDADLDVSSHAGPRSFTNP